MLALPAVLAALALVPGLAASAVSSAPRDLPAGSTCANGATPVVILEVYNPFDEAPLCIGIGKPTNGAPAILIDCALTNDIYGDWCITDGPNASVQLAGTPYCLDAGTGPHNNGPAKIWECYPGLEQQSWTYQSSGPNNTISITGGTQCLDRPWTPQVQGLHLQTYECTTANLNNNQQWALLPSQTYIDSRLRK